MLCWHCEKELTFDFMTENFEKYYHCELCEKWYEMSKERERINGAVPIKFVELATRPQIPIVSSAVYA